MNKRILIITEAGKFLPSGCVRALIYKDLFIKNNIQVDFISRQLPWLVGMLGKQGKFYKRIFNTGLGSVIGRIGLIISRIREYIIAHRILNKYDTIYLQKTSSYKLAYEIRRKYKGRLLFDLNDGLWLPSNVTFADGKIQDILNLVDAVTCDNPFGYKFAKQFNNNVHLIPDPSQVELFDLQRNKVSKSDSEIVIGWIGGPSTLFNLFLIWEALEIIFTRHRSIHLRLIGTGYDTLLMPRFERVRFSCLPFYSQNEMIIEILKMDIGLFPMFDVEDSCARGILKATIYMAGEAAVIASPRGQINELIQDGNNGMLANSTNEWVEKIDQLLTNLELRKQISKAGLEKVRNDFNLEGSFNSLIQALEVNSPKLNEFTKNSQGGIEK